MTGDATPIPGHLSSEFYAWLWWTSMQNGGVFRLPDPVGRVDVWVDDRLVFKVAEATRASAVLTGDNPSESLEARAALAGGKVLHEIRIGVRREDREFFATLKGPGVDLGGVKLPQVLSETVEETVYDRMHSLEELGFVLAGLLAEFSQLRASRGWDDEVVPALRRWLKDLDDTVV